MVIVTVQNLLEGGGNLASPREMGGRNRNASRGLRLHGRGSITSGNAIPLRGCMRLNSRSAAARVGLEPGAESRGAGSACSEKEAEMYLSGNRKASDVVNWPCKAGLFLWGRLQSPGRSKECRDHETDSGGGEEGAHHLHAARALSTCVCPHLGKCPILPSPSPQHVPHPRNVADDRPQASDHLLELFK